MAEKRNKGQGLVEFALILPILLMLLLGIIEGARIIWAYVTVQNAAREAARYAVTGRPFACANDPTGSPDFRQYCDNSVNGDPWAPQVLTTTRVSAIKNVAVEASSGLAVEYYAMADVNEFNANKSAPGVFGIAVIGQSGAYTQGLPNYGGEPGWNVRVETYYNVKMLDPIYDFIMGGQVIHLVGEVELQNEGIDANVKEYVGGINFDTNTCAPDCGGGQVPFISVQDEFNDFMEAPGSSFTVSVNDHLPNTAYKVWLVNADTGWSQSIDFTTDGLGGKLLNFIISVSAPQTPDPINSPNYQIYTTPAGDPATAVATCLGDIANTPCFAVGGISEAIITARNINDTINYGGQDYVQIQQPVSPARWPISSSIPIYLFGHNTDEDYKILVNNVPRTLKFNDGSSNSVIHTDANFGSNQGNPGYFIATGESPGTLTIVSEDVTSARIATTTIQIVAASLDIPGDTPGVTKHPEDDVLTIILRNHAPQQEYLVFFDDGGVSDPAIVRANDNGEVVASYVVPHGVQLPGTAPVPVEIYTLDYGRGPNTNKIASRTILVETPLDPYINVPGGQNWPAGSPIKIQLRRHQFTPPAGTEYAVYIQKGTPDSPAFSELIAIVKTSQNPFDPGLGDADIDFVLPFSYSGDYVIRSFLPTDLNNPVAEYNLKVAGNPYISIDNGKRWPPGATITIRLQGHAANTPYDVWLDRGGPQEAMLGTVIVDSTGEGTLKYTIPTTMPIKIEPGYPLHSYLNNTLTADNGELEVYPADLVISKIDLPNVTFDVEIPITLTIKNNNPITITNTYFDTDIYIDPSTPPNPLNNGLPPGDHKNWVQTVPANGSITVDDTIVLFGQESHDIYGRVDTSRLVFESNEGNNVTYRAVSAACPVQLIDEFDDGVVGGEWTPTNFGDSGVSCTAAPDLPPPPSAGGATLKQYDWDGLGAQTVDNPSNGQVYEDFTFVTDPTYGPLNVSDSDLNYIGRSSGGVPPSSLFVGPRRVAGNGASSSGAYIEFTNTQADVTISFKYLLRNRRMEASQNEWGEYYLVIDSTAAGGGVQFYDGGTGNQYLVRGVGGGDFPSGASFPSTNWPQATINLTLPIGTHRLFFGAKASALNADNEYVLAYLDDLLITEASAAPGSPPVVPNTIEEYHYNPPASGNPDSFNFALDQFFTGLTPSGPNPTGSHDTGFGTWQDGSVYVKIGTTNSRDRSGAWTKTFSLAAPTCVTVQGYYRLKFPGAYESDENGQVLVAVDDPANPRVIKTVSGTGSAYDSGWVAFSETFNLSAGNHTLYLGGFNNKATEAAEITEVWFDDVYVVDSGSGSSTDTQSESGGVLTLSNKGSDALSADDNGSGAGYHFLHQSVGSGPFEVYVRLDRPAVVNSNSRAGLEIRADAGSGTSSKLMFVYRNDGRLQVLSRNSGFSAVSERTSNVGNITPVWLQIKRNGDVFEFSYYASGGDTPPAAGDWTLFETVSNFTLPDSVEVGLINAPATGTAPGANHEARFKHFHVCAASAPGGSGGGGAGYLGSRCGQVEENGNGLVVIDAINTILNQSAGGVWQTITANDVLGEPSMEGLQSTAARPHATYQANIESGGTFYVWVAGQANNAGDSVDVGVNGSVAGSVSGFSNTTVQWKKMSGSVALTPAIYTFDLWANTGNIKVFKLLLTSNASFSPPSDGMSQSACTIIVDPPVPPLLEQCTSPFQRGDFEGTYFEIYDVWSATDLASAYSSVVYEGNHAASFPNFGNRKPSIYQSFDITIPDVGILTDTTAILNLRRGVDKNFGGTSASTDQLYFTLRWPSEPAPPDPGFDLITPILIASGTDASLPDLNSLDPQPTDWTVFSQDIFAGINPLSVLENGSTVRAYFYTANPGVGTAFYLDNIDLTVCSTEPAPTQVSGGRITGFTRRGGAPLKGVDVWAYAYAEDGSTPGPVFKTQSIQDGSFRFYNLPPGSYLLYASITDPSGSFFATYRLVVSEGSNITNVILNVVTG